MWARLLLLVSFIAESREILVGGKMQTKNLVGPWALVGWALMGRALMGPPGPSWAGPLWAPCALMVRALCTYGPGPYGPHGPSWTGAYWAPWALMGRALVAPPGCNNPRKSWGTPPYLFPFDHTYVKTQYIYIYQYVYIYIYIYTFKHES